MSLDHTLHTLKAAADPTRLRLLALLSVGEATVGELQEILDQSQPRVSRHLRLLDEAGLVTRFRDGHWVYYRLGSSAMAAEVTKLIINISGSGDPALERDREVLTRVKRGREREAYNTTESRPWRGAAERPDEAGILDALEESIGDSRSDDSRWGDILVVGCGDGRLLRQLGERARSVVGLDDSKRARLLARFRAHESGLANCTVRQAELPILPLADGSLDLVVINEVLGAASRPGAILGEARRVLRRHGHLVILDRIEPAARSLPERGDEDLLFENQLAALLGEHGYRIDARTWFPGRIMEYALISAVPELETQTND
jgi:DNA-binding transcriptional ArsR family regulator